MSLVGLKLPRERRLLRKALAVWGGYFWLNCPCCGLAFAGFEVGSRSVDHEAAVDEPF